MTLGYKFDLYPADIHCNHRKNTELRFLEIKEAFEHVADEKLNKD